MYCILNTIAVCLEAVSYSCGDIKIQSGLLLTFSIIVEDAARYFVTKM